ncbi:hypothetical protein TNCV_1146001 [Trichonephila clavipes]|nr:hypothetical protein TNCV_1146001 [Trichonephila clavipes]
MALSKGYSRFQKALKVIAEDMTQKLQIVIKAKCLLKGLLSKENIIMTQQQGHEQAEKLFSAYATVRLMPSSDLVSMSMLCEKTWLTFLVTVPLVWN